MKKILFTMLAVLLVTVLTCTALSGCGDKKDAENDSTVTSTEEKTGADVSRPDAGSENESAEPSVGEARIVIKVDTAKEVDKILVGGKEVPFEKKDGKITVAKKDLPAAETQGNKITTSETKGEIVYKDGAKEEFDVSKQEEINTPEQTEEKTIDPEEPADPTEPTDPEKTESQETESGENTSSDETDTKEPQNTQTDDGWGGIDWGD